MPEPHSLSPTEPVPDEPVSESLDQVSSATGRIRLAIVEDDALMLESVCEALAADPAVEIVVQATSAAEALARIDEQVDAALVDLGLGEDSGVELIAQLHARFLRLNLMVHTVFEDRDVVFQALKAGASGYVLKGTDSQRLSASIRELCAGGAPMSPRIARLVIQHFQPTNPDPITPHERRILRYIDEGLSYKEIARELSISVHTVHSHIKNIYGRLQASGRGEALARARARGLL